MREGAKMRRFSMPVLAALVCCTPIASWAIEAPQLPPSAKKLSGQEIVDHQDGVTLTYKDYETDAVSTGSVIHDFKKNTNSTTYEYNGVTGSYVGRVWIKDGMFCHNENVRPVDTCVFVYYDGSSFYDVSPEGKVLSIETKQ